MLSSRLGSTLIRHMLPANTVSRRCSRQPLVERDYQEVKQELGLGHTKDVAGTASVITPR